MAEQSFSFDDSAAYERAMGRWSRAVAPAFLDWVAPPSGARWLDVGCGTGVFTELVVDACAPSTISAVDPSSAQIEHARRQPVAGRADFQVGDAQALPFADGVFDVVVAALAINFIADRPRALSEMRRVARAGGIVAGYVWDFADERSPSGPLRDGMRRFGIDVPELPGTSHSSLGALESLFREAGFESVASRSIEVTQRYSGFDDFWQAQTPGYSPTTRIIAAMTTGECARLKKKVREGLPSDPDGGIAYSARAHAVRARVPG
jgi:ubiquinone/menaquinone biosynthesis C-methylase UbiE